MGTGAVIRSSPVLRVGVTGGIGSGKSTVCRLFAQMGRTVLSADDIARHLTDNNEAIKSAIRETFGDRAFRPDGLVNRQLLGSIVFHDHALRNKLDAIIHPHVFAAIEESLAGLSPVSRKSFVVIEAALIFESGMDDRLDYIIVVNADEETRVKRVMTRDGITRDEVLSRMQSQMDVDEKLKLADFVLENDEGEEDLVPRVRFLDTLISMMAPAGREKQKAN